MPIYQTNLWICEICGRISSTTEEVSPYDDPVINPPNREEWDYIYENGNEKLICDHCLYNFNIIK
jgi:hypothetical protein